MLKYRKLRRGPLPFRYVFLLSFVFFSLFTSVSLLIINRNIEPHLMKVAESKTRQFASRAINESMSKNVTQNIDINKLIVIHKVNGEVSYSFNPKIYNRVIEESTTRVQQYLDQVESGHVKNVDLGNSTNGSYTDGIIYKIPLGVATKNLLFADLGPRVPVRFEMLGDVTSDIDTKVIETGINNTYLEVYVKLKVRLNIVIPLLKKETTIIKTIQIGNLFLPGKVPTYYNGGGKNSMPITIPGN